MFDAANPSEFTLSRARVVTTDGVVDGAVTVRDGAIAAIGDAETKGVDLDGDYLIPGLVDVHTDHVEKHVFPRRGVVWAPAPALAAHDGVIVAGGVTTVMDSLCVGALLSNSARRELLKPLIKALETGRAAGVFRADHLLHLRCEICDPDTQHLLDQVIASPLVKLVSVMDHTPGDRQCPDIEAWIIDNASDLKISLDDSRAMTNELLDRSARISASIRAHVIGRAQERGVAVMSHDDRTPAHIDEGQAEGVTISEFPTTKAAAIRAQEVGQAVVVGAPNYVRGGSQSGNVAVKDLLRDGLVDVLASDYVPGSLLTAAFAIAEDPDLSISLSDAVAMVSARPAEIAGLTDRGRIAPGLRADLVRVRRQDGDTHVMGVWRAGQRVF